MPKGWRTVSLQAMKLLLCGILILQACPVPVRAGVSDTVALSVFVMNGMPRQVTDLSAVCGALEGTIDLSWTAPADSESGGGKVDGYLVKIATFSVADLCGDTTAWWQHPKTMTALDIPASQVKVPGERQANFIASLDPGTTYYAAIRSRDAAGTWSDYDSRCYAVQASTTAADIQPEVPRDLAVISVSTSAVRIEWSDMGIMSGYQDFDHYTVYRSTFPGDPRVVTATTNRWYQDTAVLPNTTYYYWLGAYDQAPLVLFSGLSAAVAAYVPPVIDVNALAPRAPAGIRIGIQNGRVRLGWSATIKNEDGSPYTDPAGYAVYRSNDLASGWIAAGYVPSSGNRDYAWTDPDGSLASCGEVYYYKVRAVDTSANESGDSMIADISSNLNIIAMDGNRKAMIEIPKSVNGVLYRGAERNEDVVIRVTAAAPSDREGAPVVYEYNAVNANSNTPVENFRLGRALAKISLVYDTDNRSAGRAGAPPAAPLSLYWFNGVEWISIGGEDEGGIISTLTNRLGRYMMRAAGRAEHFTITRVYPRTFTPDGDNRNDYVEFQFENPLDASPFGRVYDLRGALVGELKKGNNAGSLIWDGRTVGGDVAAPGVYIYQIEVTGSEAKILNGIVILAK